MMYNCRGINFLLSSKHFEALEEDVSTVWILNKKTNEINKQIAIVVCKNSIATNIGDYVNRYSGTVSNAIRKLQKCLLPVVE